MKKTLVRIFLLSTLTSFTIFGQSDTYLRLYANMGVQLNSFDNSFNTNLSSNFYPFQLGAGSNYKLRRFVVGTEFFNSNGNLENIQYRISYQEFTSTLYLGYDLLKASNVALEPNIGLFMGNKQSVVYENQNTTVFKLNQIGVSPSITFTKFNHSGISTALKIGFNYPLNNPNWNREFDNSQTSYAPNSITPFIQLNIGGRIKLKKKMQNTSMPIGKNPSNHTKINQHTILHKEVLLNARIYPRQSTETIILLHGGPGVPNEMKQIANWLNKKYQVVYFEQRGTGKSTCTNCSCTIEDYISDIEAVAEHFQLDSFHLFGHSWGGLYAQIYAEENPSKIKSLFLCSPSSGTNSIWKETEKEVMKYNKQKASSGEWLKMGWNSLLGKFGSDKAYRKLFKQVYKNYNKDFNEIEINNEDLKGIFADPINKTRKEIIRYNPLTQMDNPNFPICITYGEKDIYGKSKENVIKRYPTGEINKISNCGHIPWLHNPIKFEKIITKFYDL